MSGSTSEAFPQLVAFDLDYTLWDLWIDTHVTGPLRRPSDDPVNKVVDRYGEEISFYRDVPAILHLLRARGRGADGNGGDDKVVIAACSRTHAPDLSPKNAYPSSTSKPTPAIEFFDEMEIYPGSKLAHFKALHKRTSIPYESMLFFDDEHRNSEVEKLGVTFVHVPKGTSTIVFEQGLAKWRAKQNTT